MHIVYRRDVFQCNKLFCCVVPVLITPSAALVGFWYEIENLNCETIFQWNGVSAVCAVYVYNFEYTTLSTQTVLPIIFLMEFNNLHTIFARVFSQFGLLIKNLNSITAAWSLSFSGRRIRVGEIRGGGDKGGGAAGPPGRGFKVFFFSVLQAFLKLHI